MRTRHTLGEDDRRALLVAAADAIAAGLVGATLTLPDADPAVGPALAEPAATFVTLERGDALLGCVGTFEATEAIVASVARQAWNAAFADRRMVAVTAADYAVMSIKVSVLSTLTPMRARTWRDVRRAVRPGRDGLLVEAGGVRATLLPSVWEKLPDPDQFLDVLWHKAGLRPRDWLPRTRVRRYTTSEFSDPGPRVLART